MPFPKRLLLDSETVALDLKPHWWFFAGPLFAGIPVLALLVVALKQNGDVQTVFLWATAAVALGWAVWLGSRLISWQTTHFVVTGDRLVFRSGILAKHTRDIPLEKVNDLASSQAAHAAGPNGSGTSAPTAPARAATAGPTPATDRGDISWRLRPSLRSRSTSSRRFSSSLTTTRSGLSIEIWATSGSFVPPTVGMSGCSQKRVQAIGVTPRASSVSVAEGTSETTLTGGRAVAPSWPRTRPG